MTKQTNKESFPVVRKVELKKDLFSFRSGTVLDLIFQRQRFSEKTQIYTRTGEYFFLVLLPSEFKEHFRFLGKPSLVTNAEEFSK